MTQHRDIVPASRGHRSLRPGPISLAPSSSQVFVDALTAGGGTLVELGPDTRGLVWLSEKRAEDLLQILITHPTIEWVQLPWSGVDAFASVLAFLAEKPESSRPVVTSAKGTYAEPVAEHALALLLGCMRELPSKARAAQWQEYRTGLSLFERHILLVGAGGIATVFLDLVAPFRPEVTVVRRQAIKVPGATRTVTTSQLRDVLPSVDAVVIAAAATSETRHLFGAAEFAALPEHAVVINVARGSMVDADALREAVGSGRLFGAGLDVMDPEPLPSDHELWGEHRVVVTSHSADTPQMAVPLLAARVQANVQSFMSGGALRGVVDCEAGY
jgi:phosphoglycerate dehydrogenase-like enzyme